MPITFHELLEKKRQEDITGSLTELAGNIELLSGMMGTTSNYRGPSVKLDEALRAADASILFPKVISDVLIRPKEPLMIGQALLSRTINVDNVRSVEFPVMGALRAFDMADTGEYREQLPSFAEQLVEIKVNKVGLMVSLSEDLIKDSMWDLLALYIEAAGFAMLRHKEEKIFGEFQAKAHKVYDNNTTNPALWTGGRSLSQAANYSVTFDNMIDAMGALVAHEYIPTDMIMHPLAWAVLAKDPVIRNVMYTQGQIGQSVWTSKPDFDQSHNVPWNIAYQVSPFVPFTIGGSLSSGPGSGLVAANITDIYVVDRNHSVVVLQRDPMSTDEFNDPRRDILNLKVRERYGVGMLNGGRSAAAISNVRLEQNFAPPLIVGTVTPA